MDSGDDDELRIIGFTNPYIVHPLEPQAQDDADAEGNNGRFPDASSNNTKPSTIGREARAALIAHAPRTVEDRHIWHLSQDSMGLNDPSGKRNTWLGKTSDSKAGKRSKFHYDDEASTEQLVYVIGEEGYWRNHEVSSNQRPPPPPPRNPRREKEKKSLSERSAHKATFLGVSRANYRH
jgi:hypothetical protein